MSKPLAFVRTGVLYTIVAVLLVGCGGSSSSGSSSAQPSEASVRAQAQEVLTLWQKGDYSKLYSLMPAERREKCSMSQFTGQLVLAQAFLGDSFKKAKLELSNVSVNGERASYSTRLLVDGAEISKDDNVNLVWVNGRWISADPDGDCGL